MIVTNILQNWKCNCETKLCVEAKSGMFQDICEPPEMSNVLHFCHHGPCMGLVRIQHYNAHAHAWRFCITFVFYNQTLNSVYMLYLQLIRSEY